MRIANRTALAFAALAVLAACDRTQTPPVAEPAVPAAEAPSAQTATAPAQAAGGLAVEGEGLRIFDATGAARALPFEAPQATVVAAATASIGGAAPEQSTNDECGAGPIQFVEYANGLQLLFQDGKFGGWNLREPGLTTVDGVGVGMTRAALVEDHTIEIIADSTLDGEFTMGEMGGFLSGAGPDATVSSLYAGLTCFFR
jgi:hypothetical protein